MRLPAYGSRLAGRRLAVSVLKSTAELILLIRLSSLSATEQSFRLPFV